MFIELKLKVHKVKSNWNADDTDLTDNHRFNVGATLVVAKTSMFLLVESS